MERVTYFTKFKLLVWKNWLLQWNHKGQFFLELFLPMLFTMILVVLRYTVEPKFESKKTYPPLEISSLATFFEYLKGKAEGKSAQNNFRNDPAMRIAKLSSAISMPLRVIPYSPSNPFLHQIMQVAVTEILRLAVKSYPDAKSLDYELEHNSYLAGVEFDDSMAKITNFPDKLSFSIRFPGELRNVPLNMGISWRTSRLYPVMPGNYPRNYNDSDGGTPVGYLREGFLPIQNAISMAFIKLASGKTDFPIVQMRRFPYPEFIYDPLLEGLQSVVSLILILSFIYPCTYITRYVAHEKEKQLKEVMKIMGLPNWIHWAAWFVKAFGSLFLVSLIMLILIKTKWSNSVAVLTYSSWTAMLAFMIVYVITSISFCFMLSVFFSKASTAAAVTGLIWFIAYVPYMLMIESYTSLTWGQKIGWSLISNTAVAFGMKIVIGFEGAGEGLQWNNFFTPVNVDDSLTVGEVIIMMLISSVIYMIICLYVEQILPGEFGVAKKWYFPFTKKFWSCKGKSVVPRDIILSKSPLQDPDAFEMEPIKKAPGVQIIDLKKKFGKKWAVNSLTLNMYEDEITVLLGHNGAGKTTTISMLTGLFLPTSGTAVINGYDIRTDIDGARFSLGICPQYNVLFDDLSVANHIKFFCLLKGLKKREVKREINKYLKLIDIEKKANTPASKLSGGMQRKLSVCCALCGGTKVVLCDEPSSGMDPAARRHMWNLLQNEKNGRTMLLTTHFMDEADVLGDRIAIMCEGQLRCYGTPFFLKKKFGSGYTLTCIKRDDCDSEKVTNLLQQFIPEITPASNLGAELSYQLPYKYSNIFEQMLGVLEEESEQLGLNGYGISISSMEEVFLKVGTESYAVSNIEQAFDFYQETDEDDDDDDDLPSLDSKISLGKTIVREKKPSIIVNQWRAMFLKKILYTWRKKFLVVLQNFAPIYFVSMAVYIAREAAFEALPPLEIDIRKYDAAVTVLEFNRTSETSNGLLSQLADAYENIARSFGSEYQFKTTGGNSFENYILELSETEQVRINKRYLAAATIEKGVITAWLNNQPVHTAPLTVNLVHNAIAKVFIGPEASIEVINKPLKRTAASRIGSMQSGESLGGQLASNICFCMSFVTSLYLLFLIKENESRAKLLQFVGGVRVWIFWATHLVWDLFTYIITVIVLICTLACFQEQYCSTFTELGEFMVLMIIFGFAALPLTYILSSYFTEPATGFARVSTINIFLGMALYICIMVMSIPVFTTKALADDLMWLFMVYPHFSLAIGINELFMNSAIKDLCSSSTITALTSESRCKAVPECCKNTSAFSWDRPGVLSEITYMIMVGVICILILVIREYRFIRDIIINFKRRMKNRPIPPKQTNIDSDVAQEVTLIRGMKRYQIAAQNLVLNRVTKYYDKFLAVNQISLCVKQNECFGLLGVNGAGKTTTFKILTGDEKLTYGRAYVRGYSVTKDMNRVYREIGYCPQFDALLEDLTGREILRIFCLLKGVPSKRIKSLSEELALAFGFMKHMDKAVKKYSGGNKRKLSTALAIIGNPSVVYLDEPTTGMDPAARRRLWNVVCLVRDSGKAIVLTSHSMEECEALCTRLAIMVNGEFMCIGSIQHLKNKFSKGFILKIKIRTTAPSRDEQRITLERSFINVPEPQGSDDTVVSKEDLSAQSDTRNQEESVRNRDSTDEDVEEEMFTADENPSKPLASIIRETYVSKVRARVEKEFPSAVLQEYYQGMLTYNIPLSDVKWSRIFGFMERNLVELNIENYAISQTTLEEIFLDFARKQVDSRIHNQKKGCTAFLKSK